MNPANFTTLYTADGGGLGEVVSCTAAWTNISARLNQVGVFNNSLLSSCAGVGFDANDATQRNECLSKMTAIINGQLVAGSSAANFMKQLYLSQRFDAMLSDARGGEAVANFQIMNKASGMMNTANNWIPVIRGAILSVTVALTPFICLLMLTPLFSRAVKFLVGSFMILTVWSVTDAVLHQFAIDHANKLLADARQYNYGIDALRLMPETTGKILTMFGMLRASSLTLAIAISSSVIGLSSSVASAVGGKLMSDVTATGAQGEQQVLDPGQKAALRRSNQSAIPVETMANHHSFSERTSGEYAQQAGQLKQQMGAVAGAGGMESYKGLREGQGFTESFKGGGEVSLNQQMRTLATSMGISEAAQKSMAASNVNSGEAFFKLSALQKQGFTGEAAEKAWLQGAVADRMQSGSVGQQQGFTMYRPVEGQEQGKWGQVQATWQDDKMVAMQGNTVNVASTEQLQSSHNKAYSKAITETHRADTSLGESVTKSVGNSATWSQTQAAAQQLYTATNGSVDYMKAMTSTMTNSFRNSQIVDERTGQAVDKAAFAQATAGVTPQIGIIKANIEGGASWRVTTNDGKSYVVNQSAEEAQSMNTSVGATHRTTLSTVRSGQYSETAQKALAQMESVQGTKSASESATISYSRADEMREAQGEVRSRAAEVSANLSRDFYQYVGEKQFGGGAEGDREAIKYLEGMAASGKTAELAKIKEEYLSDRNINIESLSEGLTKVKGPDLDKAPDPEAMRANIEGGTAELKAELASQPDIKATDPTAQVQNALKQTNVGAVDQKEIMTELTESQKTIADGKAGIERKGAEIKEEYTAGALPLAAKKTAEAASDAAAGFKQLLAGGYSNGGYVTGGNSSQPQVASQQGQNPEPVRQPEAPQAPQTTPQERKQQVQPVQEQTPQQLAAEVTGAQPQVAPQQAAKPGVERVPGQTQEQNPEPVNRIPKGDIR